MPVYAYKGVTNGGKSTRGSVSAESLRSARAKMRQEGIFVTEINAQTGTVAVTSASRGRDGKRGGGFSLGSLQRIPAMERAVATRQLSTLAGAGIPLVEALGALVEQIEHKRLKSIMSSVRDRVNEGSALADAMQQTEQFDNLYVSMIRAGEASGALDTVLARVADYLEESVRLSNRVTSILIYPAIMLLFAMGVVVALVTVVLPQITGLLLSLNQPLPFYTRAILDGSNFLRAWWWALALGGVLFFVGFRVLINTEQGRSAWDRFRLRLPIVGKISRLISIARFSRTLSTLLASGVGIIQALDISKHVAANSVVSQSIDDARGSILEGASLAKPLRQSGQFPPLVTTMVEVGERSGELDSMLAKVAETYDEQVETAVSRLTALLEPVLILVMVGIVLVIILATLMPLLQITSAMN